MKSTESILCSLCASKQIAQEVTPPSKALSRKRRNVSHRRLQPFKKKKKSAQLCHRQDTFRQPTLQFLPKEILYLVLQYLDASSLLPFCHAVPGFTDVSAAVVGFLRAFPTRGLRLRDVWIPRVTLPSGQPGITSPSVSSSDSSDDADVEEIDHDITYQENGGVSCPTATLVRMIRRVFGHCIVSVIPVTVAELERAAGMVQFGTGGSLEMRICDETKICEDHVMLQPLVDSRVVVEKLDFGRWDGEYANGACVDRVESCLRAMQCVKRLSLGNAWPRGLWESALRLNGLVEIRVGESAAFPIEVLVGSKSFSRLRKVVFIQMGSEFARDWWSRLVSVLCGTGASVVSVFEVEFEASTRGMEFQSSYDQLLKDFGKQLSENGWISEKPSSGPSSRIYQDISWKWRRSTSTNQQQNAI